MADLPEDGRFTYTICVRGFTPKIVVKAEEKKIQRDSTRDALRTIGAGTLAQMAAPKNAAYVPIAPIKGTGRQNKGAYIEEQQKAFEQKLYDQILLNCYVFIQKDGPPLPAGTEITLRTYNEHAIFQSQFSTDYNSLTATQIRMADGGGTI